MFDEVETKAAAGRTRNYKVRSGDNLTLIAKANKVDVHDLQRWNKPQRPGLKVGQTLVMGHAQSCGEKPVQYKVKKVTRCTWWQSASTLRCNISSVGNPRTGQALKPGQMLVVSGPR